MDEIECCVCGKIVVKRKEGQKTCWKHQQNSKDIREENLWKFMRGN
jgi:hypothetical protein